MSLLSFDIDLNRIHAWSSERGRIAYNAPTLTTDVICALADHAVVLIEVASHIFYDKRPSVVHRTCAWMLYNTYVATQIYHQRLGLSKPEPLVAPSSAWSHGYPELIRHSMADVTGDNHDIREARCMQFFYWRNPGKWVPFTDYFTGFSFKDDKPKTKTTRTTS
jgi:hypothetical protein